MDDAREEQPRVAHLLNPRPFLASSMTLYILLEGFGDLLLLFGRPVFAREPGLLLSFFLDGELLNILLCKHNN